MLPPLEYLTLFLKTRISVILKNGEIFDGILEGVDNHINMMISDFGNNKENRILFIRGENVCLIGQSMK